MKKNNKDLSFEENLQNLESIVNQLESGELDLETMTPPTKTKMAGGGIALRGFGRAFRKGGKV